jgi:hypothetical protein
MTACSRGAGLGVRPLLVHASDEDARSLYRRHGLEPSPTDPLHLMILIKDIALPWTQRWRDDSPAS